jgi:hypothetical protein
MANQTLHRTPAEALLDAGTGCLGPAVHLRQPLACTGSTRDGTHALIAAAGREVLRDLRGPHRA